jgi:glucose-1-phosphate cytidylyltransferase
MQVVILAGGKGSRISEETIKKPKPLVCVGGIPIIIHVMEIFARNGFDEFLISSGYMSEKIEKFFLNLNKNKNNKFMILNNKKKFNIKVINTGLKTNTAGRLLNLKKFLDKEFFFTYCDGLADINPLTIQKAFNKIRYKKKCLITIANPSSKYGIVKIANKNSNIVRQVLEKPKIRNNWINIGFGVFQKTMLSYIKNSKESLEAVVLPRIVKNRKLFFYKHTGNFNSLDSLKDKIELDVMYRKKWNY